MTLALAVAGTLATAWTFARAAGLHELLAAVAEKARTPTPLCADVRIETSDTAEPGAAHICAKDDAVYVEVRDGVRALVRPQTILVAHDGAAVPAAPGAVLADDVLLADVTPFTSESLAYPQVSDEGPRGTVVTSAPAGASTYALLVLTIDPDRDAVVGVKYYEGSVTDLVKIRKDELVEVAGRPRPETITVERIVPPTQTTRLRLAWREAPDLPAKLFTPAGLTEPSGLPWSTS